MKKPDIAMVGLAVMGANLARNMANHGFKCVVFNRTSKVTEEFIENYGGPKSNFVPAYTHEELVQSMSSPRKIFMMVKAGIPVDALINDLLPHLDKGDILIDAGNSDFHDTIRREQECKKHGIHFLGIGVSGGEEGALKGPSIMPGGDRGAWQEVAPVLDAIAARVDGKPCTAYIGANGAGHFVKMAHNGIEYADMQLIVESYDLLRRLLKCEPLELADIYSKWNSGVLQSYLIEITAKIFTRRDDLGSGFLIDQILDKAGQKGTGMWTVQNALSLGVPTPTISAAVDARNISSLYDERINASTILKNDIKSDIPLNMSKTEGIQAIHNALYCSKIMAYAQGMALLSSASKGWLWELKLGEIAAIWRGGCIIRARFLNDITKAYAANQNLSNLLLAPLFQEVVGKCISDLRRIVALASTHGIPVPAFASALSYYDSYRCPELPQNLLQAQRDFFGAHTYQRNDREGIFHTEWE